MSDQAAREAVARMATDPEFRDAVRRHDPAVLAEMDLTEDEQERLRALSAGTSGGGPECLGQRLSKSSVLGGSLLSHLSEHSGASAAVQDEQHHAAALATPWSTGHEPGGPVVPGSDGPPSFGHGPDGIDGLNLPHHGSQGSGSETPFHAGGPGGQGNLPTGRGGDDTPIGDVSVHHDDHRFGSDGSRSEGDKPDPGKVNPGDPSTRGANQTTNLPDGTTVTAHTDPGGHITSVETHSPDGTVTLTAYDQQGQSVGAAAASPDGRFSYAPAVENPHHESGPDGGTEGSGPAVDPTWASQQHTGSGGGPEVGQERGGPNLDPTAASKVETGGSGTGGEGGVEEGHGSPLKPGEASTTHIDSNDTGFGTASYGKVDPNPVEH